MDPLWLQRLNDILYADEECLACPACGALNPIELLVKHFANGRKEKHFFSMQMLKTVVCSECSQEWLPQITPEE